MKLLSRLGVRSSRVNYFGLDLKVPLMDGLGSGYIVPADHWMSRCLSVFLQQKQGAIIDIGVNIGLYLVKLKALDAEREYFGFEPNPACNHFTQELISKNQFKKARIFPFALSDKKELRTFYVKRKADKMGSLHDYARSGEVKNNSFEILTFPASELIDLIDIQKLCAIKIDVEGFELEVLKGLSKLLMNYKPFVFCEIWHLPQKNDPTYDEKFRRGAAICELLKTIDYVLLGIKSDAGKICKIQSVHDFDSTQNKDYILVHESDCTTLISALEQQF